MQALVIPVEGPLYEITLTESGSLKTLQEAVGGWIEAVSVPSCIKGADRATAYVNEEGKLLGLPVNYRATDFMLPLLGIYDCICGPLVLAGFDPATGEHAVLPPSVARRARLIESEAS
jgi:hypothetical protein